eukprot:Gb_21476 [translate_table: standard]
MLLYAKCLDNTTNNLTEYTIAIKGLKLAKSYGVKSLFIQGDSKMTLNELSRKWIKVTLSLEDSYDGSQGLLHHFDTVRFRHAFRCKNQIIDLMANMGVMLTMDEEREKCNLHRLAKDIVDKTTYKLLVLKDSLTKIRKNLSQLNGVVQFATTIIIHVMHELSHFNSRGGICREIKIIVSNLSQLEDVALEDKLPTANSTSSEET